MRVKYKISIGDFSLIDYVDLGSEHESTYTRQKWEEFVGDHYEDYCHYYRWYNDEDRNWEVAVLDDRALITFGFESHANVEVPLALLKEEMRRILEEHDAEVAAKVTHVEN